MLDKIGYLLEECEKFRFKVTIDVHVHRTLDNQRIQHVDAKEFIQGLETVLDGEVHEYEGSIRWQNSRFGPNIGCTVYPENPTIQVPAEEYRKMTEELERLRAGQAAGGALVNELSNQPELQEPA